MMKRVPSLLLILLLVSCNAGTVEIRLFSYLKVKDMSPPTFTDSIYLDIHDSLYLNFQKARISVKGNSKDRNVLVRFVRDSGNPVVFGDTVFMEHTALIEVPPEIPVVVFSSFSDVYLSKINLVRGKFFHSFLGLDIECNTGPLILKDSRVEVKVPESCEILFVPENGAFLTTNLQIATLNLKKYRVDSANLFLRERIKRF